MGALGVVDVTIVPHVPPAGAPDNDFVKIAEHLRGRPCPIGFCADGEVMIVGWRHSGSWPG